MRFLGLSLGDEVPDAKTIWLFREQLTEAGVIEKAFEQFEAYLCEQGFSARKGQIIDASIVPSETAEQSGGESTDQARTDSRRLERTEEAAEGYGCPLDEEEWTELLRL